MDPGDLRALSSGSQRLTPGNIALSKQPFTEQHQALETRQNLFYPELQVPVLVAVLGTRDDLAQKHGVVVLHGHNGRNSDAFRRKQS
jgi:hypothetical protein